MLQKISCTFSNTLSILKDPTPREQQANTFNSTPCKYCDYVNIGQTKIINVSFVLVWKSTKKRYFCANKRKLSFLETGLPNELDGIIILKLSQPTGGTINNAFVLKLGMRIPPLIL